VQGAVGPLGQRFLDGLLARAGPSVMSTTSPPCFSFRRQAFFQRVNVRLVDFKAEIGFLHPGGRGIQAQQGVTGGNLLDAYDNFHGGEVSPLRGTSHFLRSHGNESGGGHYMRIAGRAQRLTRASPGG